MIDALRTASSLKQRLRDGAVCLGGWLTTGSADIAEALASCGFDWIAVDMEHSPVVESGAADLFRAIARGGVAPLVRLPSADPYLARRLLDIGAAGFIVPVVESSDAFRRFAAHCIYPPAGRRGVALTRVNLWGDSFDDYFHGFTPILVPQIETRAGAEACAAVAALQEVDAIFIGPYDLSADLGSPGDFAAPSFRLASQGILAACRGAAKAPGIHQVAPDIAELEARLNEGYRFVAFGTDVVAMRSAFAGLADVKRGPR